jgi:creatinine amidohydrolase/Fe(II)-dependent formamide hydrolase-like protein
VFNPGRLAGPSPADPGPTFVEVDDEAEYRHRLEAVLADGTRIADHPEPSVLPGQDWWSRMSESGVCGDATVATAEFGQALSRTTVEKSVRYVREFRTIPRRPRHDRHSADRKV